MTDDDASFRKRFFRAVNDRPLEPDDPRYVPIYQDPQLASADPVQLIARAIEWTPGASVQLLSGFRGTGKSTELRRLRRTLQNKGYVVLLCDIEDYLNLATSVDVSDFLLAIAGAFGDALVESDLLKTDPAHVPYWRRFVDFLAGLQLNLSDLTLSLKASPTVGLALKANLKNDPSFRRKLQEQMAGHLGALVEDVRDYVSACIQRVREALHDPEKEVVLLLDSMEHIRGTSVTANEVQASVENLFAAQADKLHFPNLHVIYTVPPYLKVRYANLSALYEPGGVKVLSVVKVRYRQDGSPYQPGIDAMERLVRARGDWQRLLGSREALDELILLSGGHLRDLLRLLADVILRAESLPAPAAVRQAAITQLRSESLPIADTDALWLSQIANTNEASLEDASRLADLARFLDTHLVLACRNGDEWYDVHPLIAEHVARQAEAILRRRAADAS